MASVVANSSDFVPLSIDTGFYRQTLSVTRDVDVVNRWFEKNHAPWFMLHDFLLCFANSLLCYDWSKRWRYGVRQTRACHDAWEINTSSQTFPPSGVRIRFRISKFFAFNYSGSECERKVWFRWTVYASSSTERRSCIWTLYLWAARQSRILYVLLVQNSELFWLLHCPHTQL